MSGFAHAIGHLFSQAYGMTETGREGQRLKIQQADEQRRAEKADQDFADLMNERGAKFVHNGAVNRDLSMPDGSTMPGAILDKAGSGGRQIITHKTADGQRIQWELPTPEEQIGTHAQRMAQQFTAETPTRQAQASEAATNAGRVQESQAFGTAQAGEQARQQFGVPVSDDLAKTLGLPSGYKMLPAQLSPLETTATQAEQRRTQTQGLKIQQGLQALNPATITDQASYDEWRKQFPEAAANAPAVYHPQIIGMLQRRAVPIEKQPEFDINQSIAQHLQNFDPAEMDKEIDALGLSPQTAANTKALARSAIARGGKKGLEDAQKIIEDAAGQLQKTETAVATAKATAPVKISVGEALAKGRADAAGLTPDDYQRAGEEYARTGIMPALGRDSVTRGRIVAASNQWARENGLTPSDVITMHAAYQGDKASLANFQKQRDQIVSFEQTAQKNLDQFLSVAAKIPDTGVPWINAPMRTLDSKVIGDANMAAVNAARQVANNEIAKVTSGGGLSGVLSDAARKEVSEYNPRDATFAQTKAVAAILKQDMANRHASMDATLSDIKQRIGGGGSTAQAGPAQPQANAPKGAPAVGAVEQGYRFKGGNPADPNSWEKVQ